MTTTDDAPYPDQRLDAQVTGYLVDHFIGSGPGRWTFGGEVYHLADDVDYAALGEDPEAADFPLILARKSDGAFFEVDIWATARRTTPEQRDADRRNLMAIRERAAQVQEARGGAS